MTGAGVDGRYARLKKTWAHCDTVGMEFWGPTIERVPGLVAEFARRSCECGGAGLYEEVTEGLVGKGRRDREMYVRKGAA